MRKTFNISKKEYMLNFIIIILFIFIIAKVFYGTFVAGIILLPISIPMMIKRQRKINSRRMNKLEIQFKDMIMSMADAMMTGYSVENAIRESYKDIISIYGYQSEICMELRLMISQLSLNVSIEKVIENFAERTQVESISMFSQIFSVAKKTGGNMAAVISCVADNIKLKELVKEEIDVVISAKKYEQKIMMIIPICLVAYVSLASPGYLDIMYDTLEGKIIMTIFVVGYMFAFLWSEKISSIKI